MKYAPNTREELKDLVNNLSINLGDIDTSKITDMSYLFCYTSRTDFSGIEKWDVSNVKNMAAMFARAESFNADISKWDVSKVWSMRYMFSGATSFNQPIGDWDVSNVEYMIAMFHNATSFNQDISGWDLSKVENIDEATEDLICNNHNNVRTM